MPAHVVRENPNLRGFLVLGTDAALWYSRDGGGSWQALKADFPTVPVYDVQFVKRSHDLVVATHGRGLFVLDNITPLEELTPQVLAADLHVFSTQPAQIRVRPRRAGVAPTRFTTPNAPAGAVIDYYLKTALDTATSGQGEQRRGERSRRGRVIVTVTDARGDTVVVDAAPGNDLRLTIDLDLQMAAEAALGEGTGAVVALAPQTGEVLAMVSHPTYDPNQFARHIEGAIAFDRVLERAVLSEESFGSSQIANGRAEQGIRARLHVVAQHVDGVHHAP